jgi:hypothetical protein
MPRSSSKVARRKKPVRRRARKATKGKKKNYFMAKAVKPSHKGEFTHYCDNLGFNGSSMACINFAIRHGSLKREREAVLARTFKRRAWSR